jgi:hypothetical protein
LLQISIGYTVLERPPHALLLGAFNTLATVLREHLQLLAMPRWLMP